MAARRRCANVVAPVRRVILFRPCPGLTSLCRNSSSAPPELDHFPLSTHDLRRGLHSCAASRLIYEMQFHLPEALSVATQTLTSGANISRSFGAVLGTLRSTC